LGSAMKKSAVSKGAPKLCRNTPFSGLSETAETPQNPERNSPKQCRNAPKQRPKQPKRPPFKGGPFVSVLLREPVGRYPSRA
jgi:hypothetical protein